MAKKHHRARKAQTIQVWTIEQARDAVPYLASVLRSVREYRLEAIRWHRTLDRLNAVPGKPDRKAILAMEDAQREATLANDRFQDTVQELLALDVYLLDPIQGLALVPFVQDEQLAWLIFDLFDRDPIQFWRYHTDKLATRRPLAEVREKGGNSPLARELAHERHTLKGEHGQGVRDATIEGHDQRFAEGDPADLELFGPFRLSQARLQVSGEKTNGLFIRDRIGQMCPQDLRPVPGRVARFLT
jgi:hypothetical protein